MTATTARGGSLVNDCLTDVSSSVDRVRCYCTMLIFKQRVILYIHRRRRSVSYAPPSASLRRRSLFRGPESLPEKKEKGKGFMFTRT